MPLDDRENVSPNDNTTILIRKVNTIINNINNILAPRHKIKPLIFRPNERLTQNLILIANTGIFNQKIVNDTDVDELRNALLPLDDKTLTKYISIEDLEYLKF